MLIALVPDHDGTRRQLEAVQVKIRPRPFVPAQLHVLIGGFNGHT